MIKGKYKFSDKEIFQLIQDTVACMKVFDDFKIDHGGLTPKNIMINWQNEDMRFVVEPRISSKPTKHMDVYSLGLLLLSAITMQTYESLCFLNYKAALSMIESLNQPYSQMLSLMINPNSLPVDFIHKIISNFDIGITKKFEIKKIADSSYLIKCILGNQILICDIQKNIISYINCKTNEISLDLRKIILLQRGVYIFYKKKSGCFISFHSLASLNIQNNSEIQLELNEFITFPPFYEPASIIHQFEVIYLIGGDLQSYPTSACFKIENDNVYEIKELSFPSSKGCAFLEEQNIVFFHFGKYLGYFEIYKAEENIWEKRKIQIQSIKLIANSFLIDLKYDFLAVSKDEAYIFKNQILHLNFLDEETQEIVKNFDEESNSNIEVISLAENLFVTLRKNKLQGSIELVYFYIDSFKGNIIACKVSLKDYCRKKEIPELLVPQRKNLFEIESLLSLENEKYRVVEDTSTGKIYTVRERKVERFKESFDDFFASSRKQMKISTKNLCCPKYITLQTSEESNDVYFFFYYERHLQLFAKNIQTNSKVLKQPEAIRILIKIINSLEILRQKEYYFQVFDIDKIFLEKDKTNFFLLGFEHESKFLQEKMINLHKQNMFSVSKILLNLISYEAISDQENLFPILIQILQPIMNRNEEECPNSFEYLLFLKKAKSKKIKEIFFFPSDKNTINMCNSSSIMDNNQKIYQIKDSGEMKMFGNIAGKRPIYNNNYETLITFQENTFMFYKEGIDLEKKVQMGILSCLKYNSVTFGEMLFLVGGEKEGIYGKIFHPEVFSLKLSDENFQKMENFPLNKIEGNLQILVLNNNIIAISHFQNSKETFICELDCKKGSLIFEKWNVKKIQWKERINSCNVATFIGPNNTLLFVGILDSQGILYSLLTHQTMTIDLKWQTFNCNFEDSAKMVFGNGATWDGIVSRMLVCYSSNVFILTSKINFKKNTALILIKST